MGATEVSLKAGNKSYNMNAIATMYYSFSQTFYNGGTLEKMFRSQGTLIKMIKSADISHTTMVVNG